MTTSENNSSEKTAVFLKKEIEDYIIGFGTVTLIETLEDMNDEEKEICQKNGWKRALVFAVLKRIDGKPIKGTIIDSFGVTGCFLNGRILSN